MPSLLFPRWKATAALLALVLLGGGCGRADQAALQPSAAPLAPLPATPEAATATPGPRPTPLIFRPSPDVLQSAATATAETIETNVAAFIHAGDATATAKAEWALTPEPTLLPPADSARLRELWPAGPQGAAAPSRLYLRNRGGHLNSDSFWEVRLPDIQIRQLLAIEEESLDVAAQVSPNGRFLAYVTGSTPTLRLLDLGTGADLGIALPVSRSVERCYEQLAWSPDGRTLAVLAIEQRGSTWVYPLILLDPASSTTPRLLLELPPFSYLHGWLDPERLLVSRWQDLDHPSQLLALDRQGQTTFISNISLGNQPCTTLSPTKQDLLFNQNHRVMRIQLTGGQQDVLDITSEMMLKTERGTSPATPDSLFWLGQGGTLLFNRMGLERRAWLLSLDQPQQRPRDQDGILLSPPHQPSMRLGVIGASPDGSLLVACEQPPSAYENARFRDRTARTWLYDIPHDRWTLIHDTPRSWCDLVVGWSTSGGGQ